MMKRKAKYFLIVAVLFLFALVSCLKNDKQSCCANASQDKVVEKNNTAIEALDSVDLSEMVLIPAGAFLMGSDNKWSRKDEQPVHKVYVDAFYIDKTEVTNKDFKKFIEATAYVTTAERPFVVEGVSYPPGSLVFNENNKGFDPLKWWRFEEGVSWKNPFGNGISIDSLLDHPVVHVSFEDANTYAKWAGKRLPTEAEWEYAAGNGSSIDLFPWGNNLAGSNISNANYWQGEFPYKNELNDGFAFTAPIKSFVPNAFGLYDMAGNVWEWCADKYNYNYYNEFKNIELSKNPVGPTTSYDPDEPKVDKRVMKGGSFLCNDSYCSGYRVAARMKTSEETSLQHLGFRCVKSR